MTDTSILYTIGYSKLSINTLFEIIETLNIKRLIDVRTTPYSRFRAQNFDRTNLKRALPNIYRHEPSLGGKTGQRGPKWNWGLSRIITRLNEYGNVAIMCLERDPNQCHRMWIANDLQRREDFKFKIVHLSPPQENTGRYYTASLNTHKIDDWFDL